MISCRMNDRNFLKTRLVNRKITLGEDCLKRSLRTQLETGVIKPADIKRGDLLISVQNRVRNSTLIAYNASLIFIFRDKQYLLIYNK